MYLGKYCSDTEELWNELEEENVKKLIEYLNKNIDVNLYEVAKTNDDLAVYSKLKVWLLKYYYNEFINGINYIGADLNRFKKSCIISLILGITRNKKNTELIYDVFKSVGIIEKVIKYGDDIYVLFSKDFGNIQFLTAKESFTEDKDTLDFINNLGENIKDGCHQVSFYLIEHYNKFKAVTSICKKDINHNYFHSFVLDNDNNVIDLTSNLIMSKEQYYQLFEVEELNCISYEEYLNEKDDSIKFDESKTLYELLRNALYKRYLKEKDIYFL